MFGDIVTLTPGMNYTIDVTLYGLALDIAINNVQFPQIFYYNDSIFSNTHNSFFDQFIHVYGTDLTAIPMSRFDNFHIEAYFSLGCRVESNSDSILTPAPTPETRNEPCYCETIDDPSYYEYCTVTDASDVDWYLEYQTHLYSNFHDETTFLYTLTAGPKSIETIVKLRLQLPCDCLFDECIVELLTSDSEPQYIANDGQWSFYVEIHRDETYLIRLTLNGYVNTGTGKYAVYGESLCVYGGEITVPDPCYCWSDWEEGDCDHDWCVLHPFLLLYIILHLAFVFCFVFTLFCYFVCLLYIVVYQLTLPHEPALKNVHIHKL